MRHVRQTLVLHADASLLPASDSFPASHATHNTASANTETLAKVSWGHATQASSAVEALPFV
jgi:hypothetical protein